MKTIHIALFMAFLFPLGFSVSGQNAAYYLNRDFQNCGSKQMVYPYLAESVVVPLADGRTMVVNDSANTIVILYRLNSNLWADSSFGTNGFKRVQLPFPIKYKSATATNTHLYVAGSRTVSTGVFRALLLKLDLNGNLDTSFNHTGWVEDNLALGTGISEYYHMAPMADGRIVVLGALTVVDGSFQKSSKMILRRYRKNGILDPNYHPAGLHTTFTMLNDYLYGNGGVEVDQKQTRFFASICNSGYDCSDVFVAGFDSLGAFSPLVGGTGLSLIQNLDAPLQFLRVFRDGNQVYGACSKYIFRTNLNGVPDNSFGTGGICTIQSFQGAQMLAGMLKEPTGKILGFAQDQGGNNSYLVRIKTNGRLDSTFGLNGVQNLTGINRLYHVKPSGSSNLKFLVSPTTFFGSLSEWQPKPYRIKLIAKPSDTICNNVQGIIKALKNPKCNAAGYTWYLNGTPIPDILPDSVPMFSPGVYQMKTNIQVGLGSVEVLSDSITIYSVNIQIPAITQNGGILSVSSQAGVQYQWFLNGNPISGANANTYTATQPGAYTVKVSKGTCFRLSAAFTITETALPRAQKQVFEVYPNPANDQIHLVFPGNSEGNVWVKVLDMSGKCHMEFYREAGEENIPISVEKLSTGIYTLVAQFGAFRGVKKLVLVH
jgi:uncharacterized delta-60 repeat protein